MPQVRLRWAYATIGVQEATVNMDLRDELSRLLERPVDLVMPSAIATVRPWIPVRRVSRRTLPGQLRSQMGRALLPRTRTGTSSWVMGRR